MANGNISVPMHSPALDLLPGMPRSRSLNSPLTSYNEVGSKNCHKRRHSGEDGLCTASSSSSASMMSAEVNMELCGARLSQREALVFGVPGSSNNVHRAMLKLRMLDRNLPNLAAISSSHSEKTPSSASAIGIEIVNNDNF